MIPPIVAQILGLAAVCLFLLSYQMKSRGGIIAIVNKSLLDLLPILGVLLHTGAFWLKRERAIRTVALIGSPFWLAYNLARCAYGSALGDFFDDGHDPDRPLQIPKGRREDKCLKSKRRSPPWAVR